MNGTEEEEDASSSERESLLSLSAVWVGREEVRVVCVVTNKVEGDERRMEEQVVIGEERRAGQGRAGQGRAGQGRAGQGRAGQGRAGQGRGGEGRGGEGGEH